MGLTEKHLSFEKFVKTDKKYRQQAGKIQKNGNKKAAPMGGEREMTLDQSAIDTVKGHFIKKVGSIYG